ncbi:esterase [Acrasis kona]|uniref:Esterase n=1 Tax=Acrasis kona TaxID=1008807 RepID=A0AAW2YN43_9EUKA
MYGTVEEVERAYNSDAPTVVDDCVKQLGFMLTNPNNLDTHFGIKFTFISKKRVCGILKVSEIMYRDDGSFNSAVNFTIAESLASFGAFLNVEQGKEASVGQEINASHISPVTGRYVVGVSTPLFIGKSSHVWNTELRDEFGTLIGLSRCTVTVIPINKSAPLKSKL